MISFSEFEKGVKRVFEQKDGVTFFKVGKTPENKDIAIVIGWDDTCGLDENIETYYMETYYIENHCILSAKVAYNCDDLQCDYGWDWYMPEVKGTNDVLDTGLFLSKNLEDLKNNYNYICELVDKVLDGYKNGDLA